MKFSSYVKIVIGAVFFLILVGGTVRATGAGLGCPDWPKCFGQWIPPTHESQLPADYKQRFKVAGKEIADFDAFKTWTEYVNRLVGVAIGIMIIGMVVFSHLRKQVIGPKLIALSWASLFLVSFQGWVGSIVVSTHLAGYMISIHMFLALCIMYLLFYIYRLAQSRELLFKGELSVLADFHQMVLNFPKSERFRVAIIVMFYFGLLQIMIGTQVREAIDTVVKSYPDVDRADWVANSGLVFIVHRSFSLILLFLWLYIMSFMFKFTKPLDGRIDFFKMNQRDKFWQIICFGLTLVSGIGLAYFGFPAFLQPVHLLFALALNILFFDYFLRLKLFVRDNDVA